MTPAKRAALGVLALVGLGAAGFLVGLVIGRETRAALPGATSAQLSGGVLTVRVDGKAALEQGIYALLR